MPCPTQFFPIFFVSQKNNYGSWFIIFFAAFIGWLVGTAFLELYSTVVDTIALVRCLCDPPLLRRCLILSPWSPSSTPSLPRSPP
jgi:hypothetical protein